MRYRELRGLRGDPVYKYSSSLGHDVHIARYVALVTGAHLRELHMLGYISSEALKKALRALLGIYEEPESLPRAGYEDVFEYLEDMLEKEIGGEALWLPLGRSRNDHVAAALRLYVADTMTRLADSIAGVIKAFLDRARGERAPIIGFTHGEPSFIIDSPCLFLSYAESLADSVPLIRAAVEVSCKSPLYAAGGAGTLAPVDEERVARMLGFRATYHSPYYAVGSRAFLEAAALALSLVCTEASRIAEDLVAMHGLRLVRIPEGHIATSSYMPHKENPVTLEEARAVSMRCISSAQAVLLVSSKLRYSYNLDFQEASQAYTEALGFALKAATILGEVARGISVDEESVYSLIEDRIPYTSEEVEESSLEKGVPPRLEYARIARRARRLRGNILRGLELAEKRRTGCNRDRVAGRIEALEKSVEEGLLELRKLFPGLDHASSIVWKGVPR